MVNGSHEAVKLSHVHASMYSYVYEAVTVSPCTHMSMRLAVSPYVYEVFDSDRNNIQSSTAA